MVSGSIFTIRIGEAYTNLSLRNRTGRNNIGSQTARTILDCDTVRQGIDAGFGN
jgi:hypothetical protein